jgi:dihydrodipicolinate synthase/N-acetylneuraminate lyase
MNYINTIKGPVFPVITAFNQYGDIDYTSTCSYVDFLCRKGAKIIYLMAHSSRLGLLSLEEVQELNETVCEFVKHRYPEVMFIGATPMYGGLKNTIKIAKKIDSAGADLISIIFTERYYSDIQVYSFFKNISDQISCGILIHEEQLNTINGTERMNWPFELLDKVISIDKVKALKEDAKQDGYTKKIVEKYKDKVNIIVSGGSKEQFLQFGQIGCQSYLVGLGSIFPEIAFKFYDAFCKTDFNTCQDIIENYEKPFFNITKKIGWHIGLKAAMEYFNLMLKTERRPLIEVTDNEYKKISVVCEKLSKKIKEELLNE